MLISCDSQLKGGCALWPCTSGQLASTSPDSVVLASVTAVSGPQISRMYKLCYVEQVRCVRPALQLLLHCNASRPAGRCGCSCSPFASKSWYVPHTGCSGCCLPSAWPCVPPSLLTGPAIIGTRLLEARGHLDLLLTALEGASVRYWRLL